MRVFAALSFLVLLPLTATGQPAGPLQSTGPAAGQGVLSQAALVHQIVVSNEPIFVAEQVHALQLHRQGRSEDQIVAETRLRARQWRALKSTATWDVSGELLDIARALGRHAADHLGSDADPTVPNRAIQYLEAKWRGVPVPRAARKWVAASRGSRATSLAEEVFAPLIEAYRTDPSYRSLWDRLFLDRHGFAPTSSDLEVLSNYVGFADDRELAELTTASTTELMDALSAATAQVVQATRQVATIRRTPQARAVRVSRQDDRKRRVDVANAYAMAEVTSTLLVALEPEIGRPLKVTTNAVLEVHHAFERLHSAERSGANMGLARMVFSGNLIGAALKLFTGLFSSGPSPHEIVLRELGKLRRQLATLRNEIHVRFNGLHEHLESLSATVLNVYNALEANQTQIVNNQWRLFEQQLIALRELRQTAAAVARLNAGLSDLAIISAPLEQPPWLAADLANCRREYRPADGDVINVTTFRDCLAAYNALVPTLGERQIQGIQALDLQIRFLRARPGRSFQIAYSHFLTKARALGPNAPVDVDALPDRLVSPANWIAFANIVDDIITAHPQHLAGPETVAYASAMRGLRSNLFVILRALIADFEAHYARQPSALGAILADVSEALDMIDGEIDHYRDEYYGQPGYAGRVDATGQPEIPIHEGPYAWRPLSHFEKDVPPWVQFSLQKNTRCPWTMDVNGRDVRLLRKTSRPTATLATFQWVFEQGRLARFINAEDLAVVRSGHGQLSVCLYLHSASTPTRARSATARIGVRFVFEPVDGFCPGTAHDVGSDWLTRPDRRGSATDDVEAALMTMYGGVPAQPRLPASCHSAYRDAFKEREESLSAFIREGLAKSALVDEANLRLAHADAMLKHLTAITFGERIEADPVRRLLNGDIGVPFNVVATDGPAWGLVDRAREQLGEFEAMIRSPEFGELLAVQPIPELLAETSYRYIDEQ